MKKFNVGFAPGVFDLFHIGHLYLLKKAKESCEFLIVGINTDEFVLSYKNKRTVIPYEERKAIVESIRYVDFVIPQANLEIDKIKAWEIYGYEAVFIGSDWQGSEMWRKNEQLFQRLHVQVVYLPYTQGISSSLIKEKLTQSVHTTQNESKIEPES